MASVFDEGRRAFGVSGGDRAGVVEDEGEYEDEDEDEGTTKENAGFNLSTVIFSTFPRTNNSKYFGCFVTILNGPEYGGTSGALTASILTYASEIPEKMASGSSAWEFSGLWCEAAVARKVDMCDLRDERKSEHEVEAEGATKSPGSRNGSP